jgi:hypothetical protein
MRLHTLLGRFALPVVLVALATTAAGLPAYADPSAPPPAVPDPSVPASPIPALPAPADVFLDLPERVVAVEGKSKTVQFSLLNLGEAAAKDLVVTFGTDAKPVPAGVGLTLPGTCTEHGCPVGDVKVFGSAALSFKVSPTAALPALGETFNVSVQDKNGLVLDAARVTVISAKSGIDLELGQIKDMKLAPGKSATLPVVIHNTGNKAADGIGVVLVGEPFIEFPAKYTNCSAVVEVYGVVCTFEQQTVEPDQIFTLTDKTPLKVKVAADAPGPGQYFAGVYAVALNDLDLDDLGLDESAAKKKAGATELGLEPVMQVGNVDENELNDWDNAASFLISVSKNPADSVAVGGTFAGGIGDSRTVKVGVRNDGPAATLGPLQGWVTLVEVTMPKGVDVTKADPYCEPDGDHTYLCVSVENLHKGEKALFSFTAKIKGKSEPGSVTVDGGDQDLKASNDTAELAVKVDTSGTGGGSGGLPVTGAPAGMVMGGGAALLLAGALVLWTVRRRRIVTVVD